MDAALAALRAVAEPLHGTPGRAYHTFEHVLELLGWIDRVAADVGWTREREVRVAALFHDAVYVAGRSDNEAESARRARAAIATHGSPIDADRVAALILLTARHGQLAPDEVDRDAALFLDADVAILGADEPRFAAYDRAIAVEYAAIPPEVFAAGRRRFLEGLLAAPRIYLSAWFHDRLDARARRNLARALANTAAS